MSSEGQSQRELQIFPSEPDANIWASELSAEELQLLHAILTQTDDAIFIKDLQGRYRLVNRKAARMLGKPGGQIIGKDDCELFPHDDAQKIMQLDQSIMEAGSTHQFEETISFEDKQIVLFTKKSPMYDARNNVCGLIGIARDITERTEVLQRLRRSEERLRLAQAAGAVGTWDWDLTSNQATCSEQYFQLYGLEPSTLMPFLEEWLERVHPEDRDHALRDVQQALENDAYYDSEYRIVWPDGSVHWLTSRGTVIRDDKSNAVRMVGAQTNITARKEREAELIGHREELEELVAKKTQQLRTANEALQRSERQLKGLFDGIDDAIFVHDSEGLIIECNEAASRKLGYSKHELLQMRTSDIDAPEFASGFEARLAEQFRQKRLRCEGVHICKDGSRIPVDIVTSVIEYEGAPAVLAVMRDISDIKRAEKDRRELEHQVQHSQKLESLGVMAGGIAHDFNNLLMGVMGNIDLLIHDFPADAPGHDLLEDARTTAQRAAELCNQLLAYSGKGRFVIKPVDLNRMVHEMGKMLALSLSKKATLTYTLKEGLPAIEADLSQLRQVIMNLITNASESLDEQSGTIKISTDLIECTEEYLHMSLLGEGLSPGYYVAVRVADTGKGIEVSALERIFDPFFSTKGTGRGLGLAAVLGIVRGHRGTLTVSSTPNSGTVFEVLFPASDLSAAELVPKSLDEEWQPSGTVLLVDDEEMVCNVAQQMLERIGFDVLTASNGYEALELYQERQGDIVCVLLDLSMPGISGLETLTRLRTIRTDVRVILSSGFSEQETTAKEVDDKIAAFIQKPYGVQDLQSKLRKVLAND